MKVSLGNSWTKIETTQEHEVAWLTSFLSFYDKTSLMEFCPFTKKMVRKILREDDGRTPILTDDGREIPAPMDRISLYDPVYGRIPTGLAGHVAGNLTSGITFEIDDQRVRPCAAKPELLPLWWEGIASTGKKERDYQTKAILKCVKSGRGILDLCTGAGKTACSMGIVAITPGVKWLFVVPSHSLFKQAIEAYEEVNSGEACGFIKGPRFVDGSFIVVTYQTLAARFKRNCPEVKKLTETVTGFIVDECHKAAARTQYESLMKFTNCYYRIGLSGTPLKRSDGKNMVNVGLLGRVLMSVKSVELVKRGILAKPIITMVPVVQSGPTSTDWRQDYEVFVVESDIRMLKVLQLIKEEGEAPGLVFVNSPAQGRRITEFMAAAGHRVRLVYGKSKGYERDEAFREIEEDKLDYVVGSSILDTGIDLPKIRFLLFAGGLKGEISLVQRLGRGLRKDVKTKKTKVKVFDIMDRMDPAADPHMLGNKTNAGHSTERMRILRQEGFDVQLLA